jgi:hypothetical protein
MSVVRTFQNLPTPALVLPSYHGHLLYSPPDLDVQVPGGVLSEINANDSTPYQFVLLDIADVVGKDFGKISLKELSTTNPRIVPILSYRGQLGGPVAADNTSISVNTKMGRKKVTVDQYVERIAIDRPFAAVSLADEVNISATGHNRLRKSVERTLTWNKVISTHKDFPLDTTLFFTLVVDPNYIDQLVSTLDGFGRNSPCIVIGGLNSGESDETRHDLIQRVISHLKDTKSGSLTMTHASNSFNEVCAAFSSG